MSDPNDDTEIKVLCKLLLRINLYGLTMNNFVHLNLNKSNKYN